MPLLCTAPWTGLFVWMEGTVSYCGRLRASGNLREQAFEEFWNSEPVQRARSMFVRDAQIESGCPATCCWLTARHPESFVKYYDVKAPPSDAAQQAEAEAARLIPPPRSYAENVDRIAREIETGQTNSSAFPTSLTISVTNYCSLRCPMCCFGIIPPEQKKPTAKLIDPIVLDRLKVVYPFLERLDVVGGELFDIPFDENPLVRILADVAAAKPPNVGVTVTTNGQHLSKRWAEYLVQFPFIDVIAFSVDSFDPQVYARTRVMGSLDRVRSGIRNVRDAKAARGLSGPSIRLNTILGVHTCEGVPLFVENARALGADWIEYQKLVLMGDPEFFPANNLFQRRHVDKLVRLRRDLVAADFSSNRAEFIGMIDAYLRHLGIDPVPAPKTAVRLAGPRAWFAAAQAALGKGTASTA